MDVTVCDTTIASLISSGALSSSMGSWGTQTTKDNYYVSGCSIKHTENNMRHFNSKIHDGSRSSETPVCGKMCKGKMIYECIVSTIAIP